MSMNAPESEACGVQDSAEQEMPDEVDASCRRVKELTRPRLTGERNGIDTLRDTISNVIKAMEG